MLTFSDYLTVTWKVLSIILLQSETFVLMATVCFVFALSIHLLTQIFIKELNIPKNKNNEYAYGKRDLFAVFIILKTLLPRNDFSRLIKKIERAVQTLQTRISVISINDVYREMGFPEDWKSKLLSPRHVIIPDVAAEIATTIRQNDLYISTTMNRMEIHSYKDGL